VYKLVYVRAPALQAAVTTVRGLATAVTLTFVMAASLPWGDNTTLRRAVPLEAAGCVPDEGLSGRAGVAAFIRNPGARWGHYLTPAALLPKENTCIH
jgi:hypothetical protein